MSAQKLIDAIAALDAISRQTWRSDPEADEAINRQFQYLTVVMADEVVEIRKLVQSLLSERS